MSLRCDHCRRPLGLMVRRYWHMRFCSAACVQAYQRRLDDGTKQKIANIRHAASAGRQRARPPERRLGPRRQSERAQRLAG